MKKTKPESVDTAKAASLMGQKKFNKAVIKEAENGILVGEAAELIARRKLKGMI